MTPAQITELRKLLAEATPGPWECFQANPALICISGCGYGNFAQVSISGRKDTLAMDTANAAIIATAVNALPSLLDAAEREQKLREALEAAANELTRLIERGSDSSRSVLAQVCAALTEGGAK